MPLNAKGEKILDSMKDTYGSAKKAKSVLYASKNAGRISGIDGARAARDVGTPEGAKKAAATRAQGGGGTTPVSKQFKSDKFHKGGPQPADKPTEERIYPTRGALPDWNSPRMRMGHGPDVDDKKPRGIDCGARDQLSNLGAKKAPQFDQAPAGPGAVARAKPTTQPSAGIPSHRRSMDHAKRAITITGDFDQATIKRGGPSPGGSKVQPTPRPAPKVGQRVGDQSPVNEIIGPTGTSPTSERAAVTAPPMRPQAKDATPGIKSGSSSSPASQTAGAGPAPAKSMRAMDAARNRWPGKVV